MPGSFEMPLVAKAMAKSGTYDAVITVGAVVSPHHLDFMVLDWNRANPFYDIFSALITAPWRDDLNAHPI